MLWRPDGYKKPDHTTEWRKHFCLIPQIVEGVRVWLECVERRWELRDVGRGACYKWRFKKWKEFRLTEEQKIRVGEIW